MARSKNKRKNGKVKAGTFTSKHMRLNVMTGKVSPASDNPFISDEQYKKIKSHLGLQITGMRGIRLRSRVSGLSKQELDSICSSIIHSRLLKDGEMPEGSAMHAVPKKEGFAYWNIGMFGSVWSDIEIFNGRKFRIAFLSDGSFGVEGEL